jgi:hypothetical protein
MTIHQCNENHESRSTIDSRGDVEHKKPFGFNTQPPAIRSDEVGNLQSSRSIAGWSSPDTKAVGDGCRRPRNMAPDGAGVLRAYYMTFGISRKASSLAKDKPYARVR